MFAPVEIDQTLGMTPGQGWGLVKIHTGFGRNTFHAGGLVGASCSNTWGLRSTLHLSARKWTSNGWVNKVLPSRLSIQIHMLHYWYPDAECLCCVYACSSLKGSWELLLHQIPEKDQNVQYCSIMFHCDVKISCRVPASRAYSQIVDKILEYFWKYIILTYSNKLQRVLRSCIGSTATLYGKYQWGVMFIKKINNITSSIFHN